MSLIVTGFLIGIFVGYLHSIPPARRMFCSSCTEDKKRERYVNKRIILKVSRASFQIWCWMSLFMPLGEYITKTNHHIIFFSNTFLLLTTKERRVE